LIAAGLSAEDIENMRNTFHAQQPHFALSGALDSEAGKSGRLKHRSRFMTFAQRMNMHERWRSNGSRALKVATPILTQEHRTLR
jgi:hypothetical protein